MPSSVGHFKRLSSWSEEFAEKHLLVQVVENSPGFYAARMSITYSQEPGTGPNSDSLKYTLQHRIFLREDTVWCYLHYA
jgi:hypothetical protein